MFLNKAIEIGTIRGGATSDAPCLTHTGRKNVRVGAAVTLNALHSTPAINGSVISQDFALGNDGMPLKRVQGYAIDILIYDISCGQLLISSLSRAGK